nr:hypothetical protein [uncultured Undibacterium sp.]
MRKPIESSPKFYEYKSFDKVADKLIMKWPELFDKPGKDRLVTMRSLGAKIGELDRGKNTWWLNRKDETNCLIELLGIDRDELGLNQKTGPHVFAFSVFPDFPPLDLMRENYWSIATPELLSDGDSQEFDRYASRTTPTLDAWLSPQGHVHAGKKLEWLQVPDMMEYQLLTRKLRAIGRHQFEAIASLRGVIDKDIELVRNQQPLILALDGRWKEGYSKALNSQEADYLETLIAYRQGGPLLIISPSPLPTSWGDGEYDETEKESVKSNSNSKQDESLQNKSKIIRNEINIWIWSLLPDWRTQLTQWIERRIKKLGIISYFSSEGTQNLLHKFDPSGKWFAAVEDVLMLCQAESEGLESNLEASAGGDINMLLSLLFNHDQSTLGLIQPLTEQRWKHWNMAWEGELERDNWITLAGDLHKCDELIKKQIIGQGLKGFDFQRPILIRLLLCSQLLAAFSKDDLTAWAPACFDNQRRPLVDAALDLANIDVLEQIFEQLIAAPVSAQTIGAGEALFTAVGRRIIREEYIGDELPMLADYVLKRLTKEGELIYPCSRPLGSEAQQLEWICACWAWSLVPQASVDLTAKWLFPGWSKDQAQTLPNWINTFANVSPNSHLNHSSIPIRDFLSLIIRWLSCHETPPAYENMPQLFKAGMLARAAKGQWAASSYWWWGILGNTNVEQTLIQQIESSDSSVNRITAQTWWPSMVKYYREKIESERSSTKFWGHSVFTKNPTAQGHSILLKWVMEQMDEHKVLYGLNEQDRKFLVENPAGLSTPIKRQLLKSLANGLPPDWTILSFTNFFLQFGPETALEMGMFLNDPKLGEQAARYMWEWAPLKAKSLMRKKDSSEEALRRLILSAPFSAIGDAVNLLKDDPNLLNENEKRNWARWHLPNARQHAQDLMQLLKTKAEEYGS